MLSVANQDPDFDTPETISSDDVNSCCMWIENMAMTELLVFLFMSQLKEDRNEK